MAIVEYLRIGRSFLTGSAELSQVDAKEASRIKREQVNAVIRHLPSVMAAKMLIALVVAVTFWDLASHYFLIGWVVLVYFFSISGIIAWNRLRRLNSVAARAEGLIQAIGHRSLILALLWAVIPLLLFPDADPARQLLVSSLAIGMICGGAVALAAIPHASLLYTMVMTFGTMLGFILAGGPLYWLSAAMLLMYSAIIAHDSIAHAKLMVKRMLDQFEIEKRGEVINLLLKDFEENASDWLWETDAAGRLTHVSARFAAVVGTEPEALNRMSFVDILTGESSSTPKRCLGREQLAINLETRTHFRNLQVSLSLDGELRWWSLSGKPFFDEAGNFLGFRGVGTDITETRIADERIAYMARFDALTDLANRALFMEDMTRALARHARTSEPFAVLCLDLDHFKNVNDTFGHPGGDKLLRQVADRLRACVGPHNTIARFGGDEFAILMTHGGTAKEAQALADTLITRIGAPYTIDGVEVIIGTSIGIALAPKDGVDPNELLKRADLALYRAKSAGRNASRFFAVEMDDEAQARLSMERELRRALRENEFVLHFQPMYDAQTHAICGCEALLRWQHPQRGLIYPTAFIKVAEETGLIIPIGDWIIRRASAIAAKWPAHLRIAVNLSVIQFKGATLASTITNALAAAGLAPERLELEITESVVLDSSGPALRTLQTLQSLGVHIALDDFGTGFSSLSYLRSFPFDKIKIDRSFISEMETRRDCRAIVQAVTTLGCSLDKRVTAEGVETMEQAQHLRSIGCHELQGHLFSPAVSEEELAQMLAAGAAIASDRKAA